MPRRRLEGESIRDSILAVAGNLDRTVGGPAVHPYIDPALFQSSSKRTWDGQARLRSVHLAAQRLRVLQAVHSAADAGSVRQAGQRRLLRAPQSQHDRAAGADPDEQRVRSDGGKKFAERLRKEAGSDPAEQVDLAFQLALSRKPTANEREQSVAFLRTGEHALADFCQAMINLNEFVYIP